MNERSRLAQCTHVRIGSGTVGRVIEAEHIPRHGGGGAEESAVGAGQGARSNDRLAPPRPQAHARVGYRAMAPCNHPLAASPTERRAHCSCHAVTVRDAFHRSGTLYPGCLAPAPTGVSPLYPAPFAVTAVASSNLNDGYMHRIAEGSCACLRLALGACSRHGCWSRHSYHPWSGAQIVDSVHSLAGFNLTHGKALCGRG